MIWPLHLFTFGSERPVPSFRLSAAIPLPYVDTNNNKLLESKASGSSVVSVHSRTEDISGDGEASRSRRKTVISFLICFGGLQLSFLLWGLMQERIIKYTYALSSSSDAHQAQRFKNSQFLVLTNRLAGLLLSLAIILIGNRNKMRIHSIDSYRKLVSYKNWPPLFICCYSSLSNVLSSWFQYESLKYVTFTSQLLAKSSKSIFVMLTAKVVSNKTYKAYEYFCVFLIGVGIFLFSDFDMHKTNKILFTTLPGFVCLFGYLVSDSFTSTWQDNLIKRYSVSSIALMFITNLYSVLYTFISLIRAGELSETIEFLNGHADITLHIALLSVTSAIGQIFIFVTIQKFGALVFSLIMTTRQVLAIVLSSMVFQHAMSVQSVFGVSLIFFALFLQQYFKFNDSASNLNRKRKSGFVA